jgi:hypothetical protein
MLGHIALACLFLTEGVTQWEYDLITAQEAIYTLKTTSTATTDAVTTINNTLDAHTTAISTNQSAIALVKEVSATLPSALQLLLQHTLVYNTHLNHSHVATLPPQ